MIKNRTAQIVFQSIYCTLALVAFVGSLGLFEAKFNENFYVYYTNLSNYICFGFMIASLVATIKSANKKEDDFCKAAPAFKFMCVIMILVTLLIYNILLAKDSSAKDYFTSYNNLTMHLILPIMFILDWVLFYQHGKTRWFYPLLSLIMPLVYVVFVLVRAAILKGNANALLYPYFFLNVGELGWGGLFMWLAILISIFLLIGFSIFFLDNHKFFREKLRRKND